MPAIQLNLSHSQALLLNEELTHRKQQLKKRWTLQDQLAKDPRNFSSEASDDLNEAGRQIDESADTIANIVALGMEH